VLKYYLLLKLQLYIYILLRIYIYYVINQDWLKYYFLLKLLNLFQSYEELLTDTGVANAFAVKSFKGEDLEGIRRVRVHIGNQLAKTLAGRMTIADNLMAQQQITPDEYLEIIRSGTLNKQLESKTAEPGYIQLENEQLSRGEMPIMNALDNHVKHIKEHKSLLFRPEVRDSSQILAMVLEHISEHTNQLLQMSVNNPTFLSIALDMPQIALPQPKPDTGVGSPPPPGNEGIPSGPAEAGENVNASQSATAAIDSGIGPAAESGQQSADRLMQKAQSSGGGDR
jgi:hypothetical protein